MKEDIKGSRLSAVKALKELSGIIRAFDSRLNIFVGFIFNGLFLWDLHCLKKLDGWKAAYGKNFLPGSIYLGRLTLL